MRRVFRLVLTDNGSEFADEAAIAGLLGEAGGETRLFYCGGRRADRKGGCEKNHVELRKLLPKGRGLRLDRLSRADAAFVMSQVDSEPRGKLAWRTPSEMLLAAFGDDARALLDAFGVEMLDPSELDVTPGRNMLAVCDGFEGDPAGLTCDRARGSRPLAINPLDAVRVDRITYRRDGTIGSDDTSICDCLNKTLNLNQEMLKRNRRAALDASYKLLERQGRRGPKAVVAYCKRYVEEHLARPEERQPYDGIVVYFMRKRIRAGS